MRAVARNYIEEGQERQNARVISQGEYTHSNTVSMTPHTTATSIARTVALETCIAASTRER